MTEEVKNPTSELVEMEHRGYFISLIEALSKTKAKEKVEAKGKGKVKSNC